MGAKKLEHQQTASTAVGQTAAACLVCPAGLMMFSEKGAVGKR
jgi:hypothetical protein